MRYDNITPKHVRLFWQKVEIRDLLSCWEWTGSAKDGGYGQVVIRPHHYGAHQISFFLHTGINPTGKDVCHSCDNPLCVNPAHLFLGTRLDNMRDCKSKLRHAFGEKCCHTKYAKEFVDKIRMMLNSGMRGMDIASELGVTRQYVSDIKLGKKRTLG